MMPLGEQATPRRGADPQERRANGRADRQRAGFRPRPPGRRPRARPQTADAASGGVLEQVVAEMRTAWPDRDVHAEIASEPRPSICDRARIAQLLSNLLGERAHPRRSRRPGPRSGAQRRRRLRALRRQPRRADPARDPGQNCSSRSPAPPTGLASRGSAWVSTSPRRSPAPTAACWRLSPPRRRPASPSACPACRFPVPPTPGPEDHRITHISPLHGFAQIPGAPKESRRVAWGVSPRKRAESFPKPRRGDGSYRSTAKTAVAPSGLMGSWQFRPPGAHAPGYTPLPLAGQLPRLGEMCVMVSA